MITYSDFGFAAEFAALERKIARMSLNRLTFWQTVERTRKISYKTRTYTKFEIVDGFGNSYTIRTAPMTLWAAMNSLNMPYSVQSIRGLA